MKTIIFLFLFSSLSFAKDVKPVLKAKLETIEEGSELQKKFLKETGIELGDYERTKDSHPNCIDGPLELIDLGNELNLMLGAKSLAGSLGREKYTEAEDGCVITYETSYNDVAIKERIERVCDKDKTIYHTNVSLSKGRISYVKEAYDGEKLVDTVKCTVVKKESSKIEIPSETIQKAKDD